MTPQGQTKYKSPTWAEMTGVTDSKLEKTVETYLLGKVARGAYFNKHGKTEATADKNLQQSIGFVTAETRRLWVETQKNFPAHAGNSDIILHKAISQAIENLLEGPNPKIGLDNEHLDDPTKPIRFNVGGAFSGRTTADFYNDLEPFKETKTIPKGQFLELTGRDGAMIDRFNTIRSRVKGGPVEIQHVMAIANSQWATEVSEFLGITKFEAIDQGLRSRGHEGLDKANMVTSAQAEIHDRYVADIVDGAKTIHETSLEIRRRALDGALGGVPSAPYVRPTTSYPNMNMSYIPGGDDYVGGVWKPLVDLISSGEGAYDSMFPSRRFPDILNMTIPEVVEFQKRNQIGRSAAIGRGQFLYPEGVGKLAGLPSDALFSPSNQNKMIVALIERKRSGRQWLEGRISDEQFSEQLAREWGALKSASGYVLPNNTGSIGFDEIKNSLQQVRQLMKQDPTFGTGMPSNYEGGHRGTPTKKKFLGLI